MHAQLAPCSLSPLHAYWGCHNVNLTASPAWSKENKLKLWITPARGLMQSSTTLDNHPANASLPVAHQTPVLNPPREPDTTGGDAREAVLAGGEGLGTAAAGLAGVVTGAWAVAPVLAVPVGPWALVGPAAVGAVLQHTEPQWLLRGW